MELDDLKNKAPNLSKIKKEDNFAVPEGYFETFRQRLDQKINKEEKVPYFEKIFQLVRPQLALAGMMMSVVILGYFGLKLLLPDNPQSINQNEIAQVLDDEVYYMDETFIMENFLGSKEVSMDEPEVSEELINEIIDYLLEDGSSLDQILEDF